MTQGAAYITEVSEHSEGHQQIHFKVAVPENCARMDVYFGEFIESLPRPHPSSEIIDFVKGNSLRFGIKAWRSIAGHILRIWRPTSILNPASPNFNGITPGRIA